MTTILSPNKHKGRIKSVRLVVLHTMEVPETNAVAESVARQFQNPARRASAHVCIDPDSEVRGVPDEDTAWAAPGANADGLQLEMAGYAGQTTGDWSDAASKAILERAAQRTATWCKKYSIPVRRLTVAQVKDGKSKGIVGHADVTKAFPDQGNGHWDPGPNFPWDSFLARVAQFVGGSPAPAPAPPADTRPRNADGSLRLIEDGKRGPATISRWQEVMGTLIDGVISTPRSKLIEADQRFLNTVVAAEHIRNLTGKDKLDVDGDEGPKTIRVRQFWLYNQQAQAVLHRAPRVADFDGKAGPETTRLHQHALNLAKARSGRY